MGRPLPNLELNDEELETLQKWSRQRRSNQGLALRANIVMLAAKGWDSIDVANELGTSNQTVCKWRNRFLQERLLSLGDAVRSGAPLSAVTQNQPPRVE